MKLRLLVLVLCFVAMSKVSRGQIGLYITPEFTSAHNTVSDQGVFSFLGPNQTSRTFKGAAFGGYDQFGHTPTLDAGVDVRISVQRGNNAALNQFLVGGRVNFHPFTMPIKPYVELLGGVGGTRSASNGVYLNRATFSGSGGIDYTLGEHFDLRVIEVGYQSLQTINSALIGATPNTQPSSRLINFSTGIVFVFQRHKDTP